MSTSRRLTPQERLDREAQKLAAMGVTISVTPAAGREHDVDQRPAGAIRAAAERAGILAEDRLIATGKVHVDVAEGGAA